MSPLLTSSLSVLLSALPCPAQQTQPASGPTTLISPGLARPSDLRAMPCSGHVDLRWRDESSEEASFAILRRTPGAGPYAQVGLVPAGEERFRDTTVVAGTRYLYRVVARNGAGLDSPPSRAYAVTAGGNAPVITSSLAPGTRLFLGQEHDFSVSVSDPDGDLVSLRLLAIPPGLVFPPADFESGPVARQLHWRLPSFALGRYRLDFQTGCEEGPRMAVEVCVEGTYRGQGNSGWSPSYPVTGDVTGDGVADLVIASPIAGAGPTQLWQGRLYVWQTSTLAGVVAPHATLYVPGSVPYDEVGAAMDLVDLTGDGVLDVLATSPFVDLGGVSNAGALFLWAGGGGLAGSVAPTATLAVPTARTNDFLGASLPGDSYLPNPWIADLTGDGLLDVLVPATRADEVGQDSGALYLWSGGTAFTGTVAPTATLLPSVALSKARLGHCGGQGVWIADVDGDQDLDVIAGSVWADWAGVVDSGALFFWRGGSPITGRKHQTAVLSVPGASAGDALGSLVGPAASTASQQGLWLADVTGDGLPELLAVAPFADAGGVSDAGAAYVWSVAPAFAGSLPPLATMTVAGAAAGDQLGR